jgi:hypothetical protein
MVYFDGLTQREISKRTRTPIGTVKTRIELGLRKMRERIRGAQFQPQMEVGTGSVFQSTRMRERKAFGTRIGRLGGA